MTDEEKISLSRRKALAGIGTIGAAVGLGGIGTYAQLSDTEATATTFTAGGLDGTIEANASYNGQDIDPDDDGEVEASYDYGDGGLVELGSFGTTASGVSIPIRFKDVKPGDFGCVNFTIEVESNEAWVASCVNIESNVDWMNFEPEAEPGVDPEVGSGAVNANDGDGFSSSEAGSSTQGELAQNIYTIPYYDGDNSCKFFDPDGNVNFDLSSYDGANPSPFWSNSQDVGMNPQTLDGDPISVSDADGNEYYLAARNLRDVSQNIRAVDTAHWSSGLDSTLDVQTAPDGAKVGAGCVMLDGDGSANDGNNTQGVAPLSPGDTLYFGYDYHIPFGVGNIIQGDKVTLELGFQFLQSRHTSAPNFDKYDPGA